MTYLHLMFIVHAFANFHSKMCVTTFTKIYNNHSNYNKRSTYKISPCFVYCYLVGECCHFSFKGSLHSNFGKLYAVQFLRVLKYKILFDIFLFYLKTAWIDSIEFKRSSRSLDVVSIRKDSILSSLKHGGS